MAFILPISNFPDSTFNFNVPNGVLKFRTYWSGDIGSKWMCDISDANGDAIVNGIALVTGCDNLIKGTGIDLLEPYRMVVYSPNGLENNTIDGFGTKCFVLWMEKTEVFQNFYD